MGEAGEHHSPPVISPVQVLMPLRGCVSSTISPCQPTYTYSLRTSVLLRLSVAYLSALPVYLRLSDHMKLGEHHCLFLQLQRQVIFVSM